MSRFAQTLEFDVFCRPHVGIVLRHLCSFHDRPEEATIRRLRIVVGLPGAGGDVKPRTTDARGFHGTNPDRYAYM